MACLVPLGLPTMTDLLPKVKEPIWKLCQILYEVYFLPLYTWGQGNDH